MTNGSRTHTEHSTPADPGGIEVKAAAAWAGQFARALKTCRLYEASNPTVVKFREETAAALRKALDESGPWTLRFTADDVLLENASLYPARSREDNLALLFFRDGVRALTLRPGIEPAEVYALMDCVLEVSGQNLAHDDLVTLLWEADLRHVDIDYVPAEDDVGTGGADGAQKDPLPWPGAAAEEEKEEAAVAAEVSVEEAPSTTRSDDWTMGHPVVEVEAVFEELSHLGPSETERFRQDYQADRQAPLVASALALSRACLASGANAEDRLELGRFQPRLLRQAISRGAWLEALEALSILRSCGSPDWSAESFSQELLQPISISGAVERLDAQDAPQVHEFIALARELGDVAVDWLNLVLAESQQRRNRRLLGEAITQVCRDNPERLAPWLADPRPYVVRNVVQVIGGIGGPAIAGLLQVAARHPDVAVRTEVVASLGQVEPKQARPILMRMLQGADARMFSSILHQLSAERDAEVARLMLGFLRDAQFEQRSPEEQRAIFTTLGATGGDAEAAELEAELLKGSWFARFDLYRQQVARVLARIGTPLAREILERHATSKRSVVRKACEDALAAFNAHD